MKIRWLAAGIAALLVTGGSAMVAQRVITQMTRGVLPEKNDSAHPDSRPISKPTPSPSPSPKASLLVQASTGRPVSPAIEPDLPADVGPGLPAPGSYATEEAGLTPNTIEPVASPVVIANEVTEVQPPVALASTAVAIATASAPVLPETRMVATEAEPAQDVPGKLDPVDSVESFVERNRKEAESAIQTLTLEAETLKARLVKVETALTRWQSFSRALNADQPASQPAVGPGSKLRWERPWPEGSPRPSKIAPSGPLAEEPGPDLAPLDKHSEPSTSSSVPTPTEPPLGSQVDPKPTDFPATDPPSPTVSTPPSARNED